MQMTFDELAEASGIPKVSLLRIFNEQRQISFAQIATLAEAMKTTSVEIVKEAERESVRRYGNPHGYKIQETLAVSEIDPIEYDRQARAKYEEFLKNPGKYGLAARHHEPDQLEDQE